MSFSDQIKKFNNKTVEAHNAIFRGTALDLFGRIIKRTPVDTGRLRANWKASINTPSKEITGTKDKTGSKALKDSESVVDRYDFGDSVFFINNLPYAEAIEDGHSDQRPLGMVKVTVAEFRHIVKMRARSK